MKKRGEMDFVIINLFVNSFCINYLHIHIKNITSHTHTTYSSSCSLLVHLELIDIVKQIAIDKQANKQTDGWIR